MDRKIQNYLRARSDSQAKDQMEQEESLTGHCVARRKVDAVIVADADDYELLVEELSQQGIALETVVLDYLERPEEVFIWPTDECPESSSSVNQPVARLS